MVYKIAVLTPKLVIIFGNLITRLIYEERLGVSDHEINCAICQHNFVAFLHQQKV